MAQPRTTGYSLVEIAFALGILIFVLLSAMSFLGTSMTLQRSSKENDAAYTALEQRAAAFRALLHSLPLDQENREAQFRMVLETLGGAPDGNPDGNGVVGPLTFDFDLVEGAPKLSTALGGNDTAQARLTVQGYVIESFVETPLAGGGCFLSPLDMDANDTPGEGAVIAPKDMHLLPLRLDIVWAPATADAMTPTKTQTLITVLY